MDYLQRAKNDFEKSVHAESVIFSQLYATQAVAAAKIAEVETNRAILSVLRNIAVDMSNLPADPNAAQVCWCEGEGGLTGPEHSVFCPHYCPL